MNKRKVTTNDMNAEQLDELLYAMASGSTLRIKKVFDSVILPSKNLPKVYIAGKVTGIEEEAYVLFNEVEQALIKEGYEAINPMKLPHDHDKSWEAYMKECISILTSCDYIILLPNWKDSKGARLEQAIAYNLKIKEIKL